MVTSEMSSDSDSESSHTEEDYDEDEDIPNAHAHVGKLVPQHLEKALFTKKVAPAFDGRMPWFTYEDAVEDWCDITESKPDKQGLELRNRLTGEVEHLKALLDKEKLKDPDNGVEYFLSTLRPLYVKGNEIVFLWRFFQLLTMKRSGHADLITWIPRVQIRRKRAFAAWMSCCTEINEHTDTGFQNWILRVNKIIQENTYEEAMSKIDPEAVTVGEPASAEPAPAEANEEEQGQGDFTNLASAAERAAPAAPTATEDQPPKRLELLDPSEEGSLKKYNKMRKRLHQEKFPLSDHLMSLIFIVSSDLKLDQREKLIASFELKGIEIPDYNTKLLEETFRKLFIGLNTGFLDPYLKNKSLHKKRAFTILDEGDWEGHLGYWVQDQTTLETGFFDVVERTFWAGDENDSFAARKFKRFKLKRGKYKKRKGSGKGKQNKGSFRSHKGYSKGKGKGGKRKGKGKGKGFFGEDGYWYEPVAPPEAAADFGKGGKRKGKPKGKFNKGDSDGKGTKGADANQAADSPTPSAPADQAANQQWDASAWDWSDQYGNYGWEDNQEYQGFYSYDNYGQYPAEVTFLATHFEESLIVGKYEEVHSKRSWNEIQCSALNSSINHYDLVDMRKNPQYAILDSGCTKTMGSMVKVMQFIRFASASCPWIRFRWIPARTKFSFANSHSAMVWWCLEIIYTLYDGELTIECMVLEEGTVPILVSNALMGFLEIDIKNRVNAVWVTSHAFGYNNEPMQYSTSNHQVVDLTQIQYVPSAVKEGISGTDAYTCSFAGAWISASAELEQWSGADDVASATPSKATSSLISQLRTQFDPEVFQRRTHSLGLACRNFHLQEHQSLENDGQQAGNDEPFEPADLLDPEVEEGVPGKGFLKRYHRSGRVRFRTEDEDEAKLKDQEPSDPSSGSQAEPSVYDISLKRIHNKLKDPAELLKLHLKHYHMSTDQFKKRTSTLQIPKEIYQKYDEIVKKCDACQRTAPTPSKSRVSGLRSEIFGDLLFIDHGELDIDDKKYVFLLCLDAASTLVTAYPCNSTTDAEAQEALREFFHHNYVVPKNICADHKFMGPAWEDFYNSHNINPIALGPKTPWPNRAEAAIRLYKRYLSRTVSELKSRVTLKDKNVSVRTILREACYARNLLATYGGKTPIELAFGRRPPDVIGWDNATPGQLTNPGLEPDEIVKEIRAVAMQEYLKVRQAEDIRQDLAASLRHIKGPFKEGERVWYWTPASQQGGQTLKRGYWLKGKIIKKGTGPMYIVDFGTRVLQVNASLLRRDADKMTDIIVIPDIEDTSGKDVASATLKVHKNPQCTASSYQMPVQVNRYHVFVPKLEQLRRRVTYDMSDPRNPVELADEDVTGWSEKHMTRFLPEPRPRKIKTIFYFQGDGPEQSPENKQEVRRQKKALRQQRLKEPQVIPDDDDDHDEEPADDEHSETEPMQEDDGHEEEEEDLVPRKDYEMDQDFLDEPYEKENMSLDDPAVQQPRRSKRLADKRSAILANPLGESAEDMELEDASASFQHVLWQCEMTGKIDLLELFAGSARISQAASAAGLRVGQPIDIRTGFDLMTRQGQKRVMQLILEQNPDVIFMAPVCSPWSLWSNMKDPETRQADRDAIMPMVRFVVQIAMLQIKRGKHFIIENPKDSAIWYTLVMQQLSRQRGVSYGDLDFCAYGLKDPVANNLYYRKSTSLMHNFADGVMNPLWKKCPNTLGKKVHEHQPVEGAAPGHGPRSKLSQIYPYRFCKALADILGVYLNRPKRDKTAFLLEDILELTFSHDKAEDLACLNSVFASATQELDVTDHFSFQEYVMATDCLVVDDKTKHLMTTVNALPKNTEILIHMCQHLRLGRQLLEQCQALRQHWLPNHTYSRCSVFRGTWGTSAPVGSHGDESFVFLWKKNASIKTMSIYSTVEFQSVQASLDPSLYSGVYFYSDAGNTATRQPVGHQDISKNPFVGVPASAGPDPHHPKTYADPNIPVNIQPYPRHESPVPPTPAPDQHPSVAPPAFPTDSTSTRLGGETRSGVIKSILKNSKTHSNKPPVPKSSPEPPTPIEPPPGLTPEPRKRSRTPIPRRGRSPPRDSDEDMDQHMEPRQRMTAVKTRPAPPPRPPSPYSRSRSRDDEQPNEDEEESEEDEEQAPLREASRSRDNSPQAEVPRERSRSRDDSEEPRERSRSRDDDDDDPQTGRPRSDASRSRDSSPVPRREASRSRDNSPVPEERLEPQRFHLPSGDSSTPPVPSSSLEDGEEEDITGDELVDYMKEFEEDMIINISDDHEWTYLSEAEKLASMTCSFSYVRDVDGDTLDFDSHYVASATVQNALLSDVNMRCSSRQKHDLRQQMDNLSEEDACLLSLCFDASGRLYSGPSPTKKTTKVKKRKEASAADLRNYRQQFNEAKKKEIDSWIENEVYDLVDIRKLSKEQQRNYVTGRWVLTIKREMDGTFKATKARWVLRGFQDKQKHEQQTDSPAATRPGFRMAVASAASNNLDLYHMDLKTAFLQGESYDSTRNIICQIPKEAGHPWYMVAYMKKPAYGLNDAPRRWWNVVDERLRSYGCVPTRADRCTYVLYDDKTRPKKQVPPSNTKNKPYYKSPLDNIEAIMEHLLDPYHGSNCEGRRVSGFICLHVDDLFMAGDKNFEDIVLKGIRKDFNVGSEDKNDVMFVGQRIRWINKSGSASADRSGKSSGPHIKIDQSLAIDDLEEMVFDKSLKDNVECTPVLHTAYRSVLGKINWLQSRTQFHACYKFSRAASAASKPTIGNCRELNKLVRQIKSTPVSLRYWPLQGNLRIIGIPDASYKNNEDKSSQRAHTIFLCEPRNERSPTSVKGSLIDYESHKITATTMSTTVAELYAFMRCFGTCLFMRGLWADLSGQNAQVHMRTDANNLVTTAQTTHSPEQKETIHLIQMLRKESVSGRIDDLAHCSSEDCLSDCLTKHSAKPDALVKAVETGFLRNLDIHPPFRTLLKNKAFFLGPWIARFLEKPAQVVTFLCEEVTEHVYAALPSLW